MLSALLALSAIKHAHAVARLDFGGDGVSGSVSLVHNIAEPGNLTCSGELRAAAFTCTETAQISLCAEVAALQAENAELKEWKATMEAQMTHVMGIIAELTPPPSAPPAAPPSPAAPPCSDNPYGGAYFMYDYMTVDGTSGLPGCPTGSPYATTPGAGYCRYDGNDYATSPMLGQLKESMTFLAWVRPRGGTADVSVSSSTIASGAGATHRFWSWSVEPLATDNSKYKHTFGHKNNGGSSIDGDGTHEYEQWAMLTLTIPSTTSNGGEWHMWHNGVKEGTWPSCIYHDTGDDLGNCNIAGDDDAFSTLNVGARRYDNALSRYLRGDLHFLGLWDRVLTDAEIRCAYDLRQFALD